MTAVGLNGTGGHSLKQSKRNGAAHGQKHLLPFTCVNGLIQKQVGSWGSTLNSGTASDFVLQCDFILSFTGIIHWRRIRETAERAGEHQPRHTTTTTTTCWTKSEHNRFCGTGEYVCWYSPCGGGSLLSTEMLNKRLAGSHWEWSEWGCCVLAGSLASS